MMEWTTEGQLHLANARRLHGDGIAAFTEHEYERAHRLFRRALEIRCTVLPQQHPLCVSTFEIIAHLYRAQGESDKAYYTFKRVYELQRDLLGPNHFEREGTISRLIDMAADRNDWDYHSELTAELWKVRSTSQGTRQLEDFNHTLGVLPLKPAAEERAKQARGLMPDPEKVTKRTSPFLTDEWLDNLKQQVLSPAKYAVEKEKDDRRRKQKELEDAIKEAEQKQAEARRPSGEPDLDEIFSRLALPSPPAGGKSPSSASPPPQSNEASAPSSPPPPTADSGPTSPASLPPPPSDSSAPGSPASLPKPPGSDENSSVGGSPPPPPPQPEDSSDGGKEIGSPDNILPPAAALETPANDLAPPGGMSSAAPESLGDGLSEARKEENVEMTSGAEPSSS